MNYRDAIARRNLAYTRWQNAGAGQSANRLQDYCKANIDLAQAESVAFLESGDHVIALRLDINVGHGKVIACNHSDGSALIQWQDGSHGRYPVSDLRFVEYRTNPEA